MRDILFDRLLVDPDSNTVVIFGRVESDCACFDPDGLIEVTLHLDSEGDLPAWRRSVQADLESATSGFQSWSATFHVPSRRTVCGRQLEVSATASDTIGPCASKPWTSDTTRCCPEITGITAKAGKCTDNGSHCQVTVSFTIVRHDRLGRLTGQVTMRQTGQLGQIRETVVYEADTKSSKTVSVPLWVDAPTQEQTAHYDLSVDIMELEGSTVCTKMTWPLTGGIDIEACPCVHLEGKLTLEDPTTGQPVTLQDSHGGPCTTLTSVRVIAPPADPADPALSWTNNATPEMGTRNAIVHVPQDGDVEVTAILGNKCRTNLSVKLRRCPPPRPPMDAGGQPKGKIVDTSDPPLRPWYCVTLEGIAMTLLLVAIFSAFMALCVAERGSMVAAYLAETVYGAAATEAEVAYIAFFFLVMFVAALIISLVAFLFWYFLCKPSGCRVWEDFAWVLTWGLMILPWMVVFCHTSIPLIGIISFFYFIFAKPYITSNKCTEQPMFSLPWLRP